MMDILLIILACLCFLIGIVGCIIPAVPGLPGAYIGLWLMHWTSYVSFPLNFMMWWMAIVATVALIDLYLPVWFTRRFGGSRSATIGSMVGLLAGLFLFPPVGVIVCPFFGALIGQLAHDRSDSTKAFKVAFGSFAAFILGTGMKLITCGVMLYYVVKVLVA